MAVYVFYGPTERLRGSVDGSMGVTNMVQLKA